MRVRLRRAKLRGNAVRDSDLISGGETVNDVSKIPVGLARPDKNFPTTVKTQFRPNGIRVHFMGNSPGDGL
jgi:hypothetical protein